MLLTSLLFVSAQIPIRDFKEVLGAPNAMNNIYGGKFENGRLWLSNGVRIGCVDARGKPLRYWDTGGATAPIGDRCWVATGKGVVQLGFRRGHQPVKDPDEVHIFDPPSNLWGRVLRTLKLGSNPNVARCHNSPDVIALAGNRLWLLSKGTPVKLGPTPLVSHESDVILDAYDRDSIAVCLDELAGDKNDIRIGLTRKGTTRQIVLPGDHASAILRADRDLAFVLITQDFEAYKLYRIDVPSGRVAGIGTVRRDYRNVMAWDNKSRRLYLNYIDGDLSHVQCMNAAGKVLWRSKAMIEPATDLSIDQKTGDVYCVTKVGPIYVLAR